MRYHLHRRIGPEPATLVQVHFLIFDTSVIYQIFIHMCEAGDAHYQLTDESKAYLKEYWSERVANKDKDFGNAREVRNYFEKVIKRQTNRLAITLDYTSFDESALMRIELEDVKMD